MELSGWQNIDAYTTYFWAHTGVAFTFLYEYISLQKNPYPLFIVSTIELT